MGVQNFIPELWSKRIQKELDRKHMLVKNCTREYSGEISGVGSKVKINSINTPTIGDYVPNVTVITAEELKDESRMLEITQSKYFAFQLDKVDKKQATGGLLEEGLRKAIVGLNDLAEQFVATKFDEADQTLTITDFTSGKAFSTFIKARRLLSRNNVGDGEAFMEVTPEVWEKLGLADITFNNQDNGESIRKGKWSEALGMMVFQSNNLPISVSTEDISTSTCAVRTKEAIGYAEQIMETEKYRPESKFSDAVKGLHVYGAKTLKPKEIIKLVITTAAETTI